MKLISTKRLTLRKLEALEKKRLVNLIGNYNVSRCLSNVPFPYLMKDADNWFKSLPQKKYEFNLNIYNSNLLIGGVALTEKEGGYYNLGYWLGENYWGYGFATEAAKGLIEFIKLKNNSVKINAEHSIENKASENVLKKLGFEFIRYSKMYSISKKEEVITKKYILK